MVDRLQEEGPQTRLGLLGSALAMPLVFWPLAWTLWAGFFRGGMSLRMMGLRLVRRDGRPASRLQCAFRTLLVWLPLTLVLLLTNLLFKEHSDYSVTVWFCAVGLLAAYLYIALLYPTRALHDLLAGTWLVPE